MLERFLFVSIWIKWIIYLNHAARGWYYSPSRSVCLYSLRVGTVHTSTLRKHKNNHVKKLWVATIYIFPLQKSMEVISISILGWFPFSRFRAPFRLVRWSPETPTSSFFITKWEAKKPSKILTVHETSIWRFPTLIYFLSKKKERKKR